MTSPSPAGIRQLPIGHMLLNDPELMLESDFPALRTAERITAIGCFTVTVDTPEELLAKRTRIEHELEAKVQPHQRAISAPGFVLVEWGGLNIYGETFAPAEAYDQERASGAGPTEAGKVLRRVDDAATRGWFWGRYYSSAEPEGELGCMHRAHIAHALTRAEFETARQELWP